MKRPPRLLWALVGLTVVATAADHWTTYLCLRQPVPGWEVSEANPLAAWLFAQLGLVPGILLDSAVSAVVIACVLASTLIPSLAKHGFFALVAVWTSWAVVNNFQAIVQMGLSPLGGA